MSALLTAQDVAARWSCSPSHVRRLARSGRLAGMRLGTDWRFSLAAVEAYEAGNTSGPAVAAPIEPARPVVVSGLPEGYVPVFPELWGGTAASPAARRGVSATTRKRA